VFLSQALDRIYSFSPEQFSSLSEVLSPELIEQCLQASGTVTLRKRRLPLEMMVWSVVGMALFRHMPMSRIRLTCTNRTLLPSRGEATTSALSKQKIQKKKCRSALTDRH